MTISREYISNVMFSKRNFDDVILDFEKNKWRFGDATFDEFIDNALEYKTELELLEKTSIENKFPYKMTDNLKERFELLENLKNEDCLISGRKPLGEVDNSILEYIDSKIDNNWDNFTKARAIYVELCNVLYYNAKYLGLFYIEYNGLITEDEVETLEEIKNQDISTVSLENNRLICYAWADLYGSILTKYGIDCLVDNGKGVSEHTYVLFEYNGIIIKTDATGTYLGKRDNIRIHDFARVKGGIEPTGFDALDSSKNIDYLLNAADRKAGINLKTYDESCDNIRSKYCTVQRNTENKTDIIREKLIKVKTLCSYFEHDDYEYICCLKTLLFNELSKEDLEILKLYSLFSNKEEDYIINLLFVINDKGNYEYYLFNHNIQEKFEYKDIKSKINNKELIKKNPNFKIKGIE